MPQVPILTADSHGIPPSDWSLAVFSRCVYSGAWLNLFQVIFSYLSASADLFEQALA
jgi:hypothetical protein